MRTLRILFGRATVDDIISPLARLPEQLEKLATKSHAKHLLFRAMSNAALDESGKAGSIAEKLKALLS